MHMQHISVGYCEGDSGLHRLRLLRPPRNTRPDVSQGSFVSTGTELALPIAFGFPPAACYTSRADAASFHRRRGILIATFVLPLCDGRFG